MTNCRHYGTADLLGVTPNIMFGQSNLHKLPTDLLSLKQCIWIGQSEGKTAYKFEKKKLSSKNKLWTCFVITNKMTTKSSHVLERVTFHHLKRNFYPTKIQGVLNIRRFSFTTIMFRDNLCTSLSFTVVSFL